MSSTQADEVLAVYSPTEEAAQAALALVPGDWEVWGPVRTAGGSWGLSLDIPPDHHFGDDEPDPHLLALVSDLLQAGASGVWRGGSNCGDRNLAALVGGH